MKHHQIKAAQEKIHKQMQQADQNHEMLVGMIKEKLLGKCMLLNIQQQGIGPSFIVDIACEFTGCIAVKLASIPEVNDSGQWFDWQTIRVYEIYDEEKTNQVISEFKAINTPKIIAQPVV